MNKFDSFIVAINEDRHANHLTSAVKFMLGGKTAGHRIEVVEGDREGGFEVEDNVVNGEGGRKIGKKVAFLDVVSREHG